MTEVSAEKKESLFVEFFHTVKEYLLVIAMVIAALKYLSHYIEELAGHLNYLKWGLYILISLIIYSLYFFTVRPTLLKRKELNLKPKGEPNQTYFTTSPRFNDRFKFFTTGYEQYLDWLRHPKSPILYLTGSSGSGKSSLINAYLAPNLENSKSIKTSVYLLRSYHNPLKVLYEALSIDNNFNANINKEVVLNEIKKISKLLSPNEQVIIVLDQFEEFFLLRNDSQEIKNDIEETAGLKELKTFFHEFIKASPKSVYILLSYRDDFQQLIDRLELPARIEHINFEQVKLLSFDQATKFLKNCPGLEVPEQRLNSILKEAASIDTPIAIRPIVLNLLGIILLRMLGKSSLSLKEGNLIRKYIIDCLGQELKQERATLLKAMLTDFNTAKPRTINELSKISNLNVTQLDNQMLSMQHDGLVRCLDIIETTQGNRKWQISHDFIAVQLEKVVYGITKIFWHKARPWIAPLLTTFLVVFSSYYYLNTNDKVKKMAIEHIEKSGLVWNTSSKSISINDNAINDSIFQQIIPDIVTLQPDFFEFDFSKKKFGGLGFRDANIKNIDGLDKVTSFKKFILTGQDSLLSINGLKGSTDLTYLNLRSSKLLRSVECLEKLTKLSYLDLSYCNNLQNIDALRKLSSLTHLELHDGASLKNIDALRGLIKLTHLDLYNYDSLKSIDALKNLKGLTYLSLSAWRSLQNIDALANLTNLKELDLSVCLRLQNLNGIKKLENLEELNVRYCKSLTDISAIKYLKSLKTLDLSDDDQLENVASIENLKSLKALNLKGCTKLQNVASIENLKSLKALNLKGCTKLQNVDFILNLKNLEYVNLYGCIKIPKQKLKSLKRIMTKTKINLNQEFDNSGYFFF